jgi:uncharacterized protein (TIGR03086 family)
MAEDVLVLLRAAVGETLRLVDGVTARQWALPTPCEDMDVAGLVVHVVGGLEQFAAVGAGEPTEPPAEHPGADAGAYRSASEKMLDAWSRPGVIDRVYPMDWGETPGEMLMGFSLIEQVVHGWDLARATGQTPRFPPDVVAATLRLAHDYDDESIRVPGMFGPAVPVADDAPALDRLAAFLGRRPDRWIPVA